MWEGRGGCGKVEEDVGRNERVCEGRGGCGKVGESVGR